MLKRFALVLLAVLAAAPVSAQQVPLIDRDLFFGDPEISGAQISPDGRYISFRKPYRGVMNIWVKGVAEPFDAARPMTADTLRPVLGYFWSRDSRLLLYVQDKGGNENSHIYAVEVTGAAEPATGVPAARDLTPYGAIQARINAVPWETPGTIVVSLNDRDPQVHDVYRLDLATGERTLVLENTVGAVGFFTDEKGNVLMGVRLSPADGSTEILRVEPDGGFTPVYTCSNEETCSPLRVHKDGKRVYMMTNKGDDVDLIRLVLFDPATGTEEFVEADPEGQADFSGAAFSDITGDLLVTVYVGDRARVYPKTDEFKRIFEQLAAQLPEGEIGAGSRSQDERFWIFSVSRDVDPGSAYLFDKQTGKAELLYRSRPTLPAEHLAFAKPVRYPARDGLSIPAYLTLPRGLEPKGLPTVILPHGGPWARDAWGYDPYAQFLANRGYAVLQPNFRGSTGYGKAFLNAGNGEWGTGAMQHDISDGVAYLVKEGIADPARVGIFGGSYGGYATLAGLAFTPDLYAAGVSYVGPSNLLTLLKSIPPYWAPIRKIFDVRLGNPDDPTDRARLVEQSPLTAADQIRAPLLVIQGANDPRVNKAESEQIVVSLRERGRPVEYLLAPDEGHGFAGRENRLAVAVAMERFFAKHLGGRAQESVPADIAAKLGALTVDVATVAVSTPPAGGAAMAGAALAEGFGARVEPVTLTYATTVETMGQKREITATRTVAAASHEGRPVWRVIDGGMGGADTLDLDAGTLRPVRRAAVGTGSVTLTYAPDGVTGELKVGPNTIPVNVGFDGAVFAEGAGLDLLIGSLDLTEGFASRADVFFLLAQKVRPMRLAVTGMETVTTAAGDYETWVVEVTPLDDDPSGTATYHLSARQPHVVVKSTTRLPAMMGGGTVSSVLAAIEPAS